MYYWNTKAFPDPFPRVKLKQVMNRAIVQVNKTLPIPANILYRTVQRPVVAPDKRYPSGIPDCPNLLVLKLPVGTRCEVFSFHTKFQFS